MSNSASFFMSWCILTLAIVLCCVFLEFGRRTWPSANDTHCVCLDKQLSHTKEIPEMLWVQTSEFNWKLKCLATFCQTLADSWSQSDRVELLQVQQDIWIGAKYLLLWARNINLAPGPWTCIWTTVPARQLSQTAVRSSFAEAVYSPHFFSYAKIPLQV
jgi:hypothetical protein